MKNFLEKYNDEPNLIKKLTLMYDIFDEKMELDFNNAIKFLKELITKFNGPYVDIHQSELKTLLIISKPFKNNIEIKNERLELLNIYNKYIENKK